MAVAVTATTIGAIAAVVVTVVIVAATTINTAAVATVPTANAIAAAVVVMVAVVVPAVAVLYVLQNPIVVTPFLLIPLYSWYCRKLQERNGTEFCSRNVHLGLQEHKKGIRPKRNGRN